MVGYVGFSIWVVVVLLGELCGSVVVRLVVEEEEVFFVVVAEEVVRFPVEVIVLVFVLLVVVGGGIITLLVVVVLLVVVEEVGSGSFGCITTQFILRRLIIGWSVHDSLNAGSTFVQFSCKCNRGSCLSMYQSQKCSRKGASRSGLHILRMRCSRHQEHLFARPRRSCVAADHRAPRCRGARDQRAPRQLQRSWREARALLAKTLWTALNQLTRPRATAREK